MWKLNQPVDVRFGAGIIENIGSILKEKNIGKSLLIADPFSAASGLAERIQTLSDGIIADIISEIEPNPSVQNVDACILKAKEIGAQAVIALGGGSAMDCAKATAAGVKMNIGGDLLVSGTPVTAALPVAAIPTTAGTGSEVTAVSVISDKEKGIKRAIISEALFPKLAVVDPQLTYTCPPAVTASSGIDVLAHALDALTSVKASPATDALALYAAKTVFEHLEKAYADGNDATARNHMSQASVLAGLAFAQTGTTGSHACSYYLTSKYGIPHGEACAFTLDDWFRVNAAARPQLHEYARMMGFENAEAVADEVAALKKKLGLRTTLAEINAPIEDLDEIARHGYESANMANNIAKVSMDEIRDMFAKKA